MRTATCATLLSVLILVALSLAALAAIPEGKIAVIRAKDVDGLATAEGSISERISTSFAFDGRACEIDRAALSSLDDVHTLLLIDHEEETVTSGGILQESWQEVVAIRGSSFAVEAVPELELEYEVIVENGRLLLAGGGSQVLCTGGEGGPYHVWSVEKLALLDRDAVKLR